MSNVPNVADVVEGWLSYMKAKKIAKQVINGDVEETEVPVNFQGMIQVLSPYELSIKPEGERSWNWINMFCDYANFKVDDKFIYNDTTYRVMKKHFWQDLGYGYYQYECIRDYE